MCDPITALTAASVLFAGYSSIQQGNAQNAAFKHNAAVAENNAKVQEYLAEDAIDRGAEEARKQRLRTRQLKGEQRASLAANGGLVDTGSSLEFILDTVETGELDALTIENNAEREASDHRIQAQNLKGQASLSLTQGKNAASSGLTNAAGTLLSGGAKASSQWYDFKKRQG